MSNQFAQCAGMYREYYISSVKVEYRPAHLDAGSAAAIVVKGIISGTAMDRLLAFPANSSEFGAALDTKPFDPMRPFKRFYRVSKYAKQKFVIWRSCADAVAGGANGGFHVLPNCQTNIYCETLGLGAGATIGEVFVTYYVRFHHRTRA